MLAIVFALGSSSLWGLSDFVGGLLSRRHSVVAVTFLAQTAALMISFALLLHPGSAAHASGMLVGFAAGLCGSISITAFYAAISIGLMSVASPILASGSIVSFGIAVAA